MTESREWNGRRARSNEETDRDEAGPDAGGGSRRLVVAAPSSGSGKTTVTLGLMAALKNRGYEVQGFKCGPDYIDPTYHTALTGRPSRNLDSWMTGPEAVKEIYIRGSRGADISVIEGVMGLFDGKNPRSNQGSTAEIAMLLDAPVLLVVDCSAMARSAAAIVKGFQTFAEGLRVAAVIANRVGSIGHYRMVREAVEQECGIPVAGYLRREDAVSIPERQLGLIPSIERGDCDELFGRLGSLAEAHLDMELLVRLSEGAPVQAEPVLFRGEPQEPRVRIAVAKDASFSFYYPENLELLEHYGAECVYFSPLAGEPVPEGADGLYLGGGFPEEFAGPLSEHAEAAASIRRAVESGMPALAECGGFMYLTESLADTEGREHAMAGLLPGRVRMQTKLAALGYRTVRGREGNFLLPPGEEAKGHEFHYSVHERPDETDLPPAYETEGLFGSKQEGFVKGSLAAGYTHLYFPSNPGIVERWIEACLRYRASAVPTGSRSPGTAPLR
ncbi:cobyrinate a,c-diamide synthase [Paenibacillus aurantius]|uniref:Cobyrinate a,c-diamide synthase n=1 Tax=Paenibacillus aurantius TaxID=2918900 RepID=A0AA96LD16_9BACL|nr:cobyrinate a,c-diamide synthase [Paenibacillus aurantius]WNQ10939.1 cobyrinate a,c-diamide synthase [Paenibacillus aurantius]